MREGSQRHKRRQERRTAESPTMDPSMGTPNHISSISGIVIHLQNNL
ncbi:MAG: hypothetical protein J5I59_03285 [Saprospiraceae bacterium]|nr:hypothetical protein [Saprospiraceae bacterium]